MSTNRFSKHLPFWLTEMAQEDVQAEIPHGFMQLPVAQLPVQAQNALKQQQALYRLAYDRAQAAAELSFLRDWFGDGSGI